MKLQITSASGNVLSVGEFAQAILMTESGEITILPEHEPLVSAIRPGILHIKYPHNNTMISQEYATGGGVVQISSDGVVIIADVVESADNLTDLEYIEAQKQEAEKIMKQFREENPDGADPKRLQEIEYDILKYTAMSELGRRIKDPTTSGRR